MKGFNLFTLVIFSLVSQAVYSQSVQGTADIAEPLSDEIVFSLYPNPAGNSTTVSINFGGNTTTLDIFILEMNGKIIREYNYDSISGSGEFTLALDCLTNGIYSVAVQTNETYRVERLIVLK